MPFVYSKWVSPNLVYTQSLKIISSLRTHLPTPAGLEILKGLSKLSICLKMEAMKAFERWSDGEMYTNLSAINTLH